MDIYLVDFPSADGQAVPDACEFAGQRRQCSGFVLVDNDFNGGGYSSTEEGLRTVVPHELFHLVQYAYHADMDRFWVEGSAQWAAKRVYPDLDDLEQFLPAYFNQPWRPLDVPPSGIVDGFLYASAIWPTFLSTLPIPDLVRLIFEEVRETPDAVLEATDRVLARAGTTLADEYAKFATFNAATGRRALNGFGYPDAARYPEMKLEPLSSAVGTAQQGVGSGLGSFFYSIDATDGRRRVELETSGAKIFGASIPVEDGVARLDRVEPLPAAVEGPAIVVVTGTTLSKMDAPFTLRVLDADIDLGGAGKSAGGTSVESSGCALAFFPAPNAKASGSLLLLYGMLGARLTARRRRTRRVRRGAVAVIMAALFGCTSESLNENAKDGSGGSSAEGGAPAKGGNTSTGSGTCGAALRQALAFVDAVSPAEVRVIAESNGEKTLYVDASTGGLSGQNKHPWLYLALASGERLSLTDSAAFEATTWDLAFKRSTLRTNSGESGPGNGGALRVNLAWDDVTRDTLGGKPLPAEDLVDAECRVMTDATGAVVTTFSNWSQYDEATHMLTPAPVVYLVAGGDGALYKVAIEDYYANPDGSHGPPEASGRYKLRVALLP